jgi:hypothetical protein
VTRTFAVFALAAISLAPIAARAERRDAPSDDGGCRFALMVRTLVGTRLDPAVAPAVATPDAPTTSTAAPWLAPVAASEPALARPPVIVKPITLRTGDGDRTGIAVATRF